METKLLGAKVRRAGVTARYWTPGTVEVTIVSKPGIGVSNRFTLTSKGGGNTQIEYTYSIKDYEAHLKMMVETDRNAALLAMSKVMQEQMEKSPEREAEIVRSEHNKIVEATSKRRFLTTGVEKAAAEITHECIVAVIKTLETSNGNPALRLKLGAG